MSDSKTSLDIDMRLFEHKITYEYLLSKNHKKSYILRGSQYQINKATGMLYPTVQNSVEEALKKVYRLKDKRPIIVRICSRTDSGVHAFKAALHVDLPKRFNKFLLPFEIKEKLNKYFTKTCSIRVTDVIRVADSFSFKEACLSKTYLYRVGVVKEEFYKEVNFSTPISETDRTFFLFSTSFDVRKAEEATHLFVGKKDFAAVGRKPRSNIRPTVCHILSFTIESASPQIPSDYANEKFLYYHFICKGTRFLFHMMRAMVGAVLSVGIGKTNLDEIRMLFEKPEPSSWKSKISVVPGFGLYLLDTTLDPEKLILGEKDKCEGDESLITDASSTNSSRAEAA